MIGRDEIRPPIGQGLDRFLLLFFADWAQMCAADPSGQPGGAGDGKTVPNRVDQSGMGATADDHHILSLDMIERHVVGNGVLAITAIAFEY